MKKAFLILIGLAVIACFFSCKSDVIIDNESEFTGAYEGEYLIIENFSDPGSQITRREKVIWTMTDFTYDCTADTSDANFPPITCDFFGSYAVENNLVLGTATSKRNRTCNPDDFADGEYAVRRTPNADDLDSLILTQVDLELNEQRILRLKQAEDTTDVQ